jgi:hypothetical protein
MMPALFADIQRRLPKQRHIREASRRNPPILEIKERDSQIAIPRVPSAERDDLFGVLEGHATKQHGVHEGEYGTVRRDARRKGCCGDEGEPSAFDEQADREAKILKKAHRDGGRHESRVKAIYVDCVEKVNRGGRYFLGGPKGSILGFE